MSSWEEVPPIEAFKKASSWEEKMRIMAEYVLGRTISPQEWQARTLEEQEDEYITWGLWEDEDVEEAQTQWLIDNGMLQ